MEHTTHVAGHSLEINNEFKAGKICKFKVGLSFAKGFAEWFDKFSQLIRQINKTIHISVR